MAPEGDVQAYKREKQPAVVSSCNAYGPQQKQRRMITLRL